MPFTPLPKELHPEFSRPRVKPTGAVEIDWSNPLARGLKTVVCKNLEIVTSTNANFGLKTRYGQQGYGVTSGTNGGDVDNASAISQNSKYSVFMHIGQSDFTGNPGRGNAYYCERPNSTQIFKIINHDDDISFVTRNAAGGGLIYEVTASPVLPDLNRAHDRHTICFVKRSDTDRDLYCDGNIANTTISSGGSYNDVTPTLLYDPQDSLATQTAADIYCVYTFDRALSDAEYRELDRDPYQILKPSVDLMGFWSAGAPPAANDIPVFLQHFRNQGQV